MQKNKMRWLATLWITGKLFCVGLRLQIVQSNLVLSFVFLFPPFKPRLGNGMYQSSCHVNFFVYITSSLQSHPSFYPVAHIAQKIKQKYI